MYPLSLRDLPPNTEAIIIGLAGGFGIRERLVEMGFIPGTRVRVLDIFHGSIIVEVRGTRYALSRGMAKKILVRPV